MQPRYETNPNWSASPNQLPIALHWSPQFNLEIKRGKRPILLLGGTHGDEPEGVWLAEDSLRWLNMQLQDEELPRHPWALITCLNPDGFLKNERVNSRGVDLNRNFPEKNWSTYHTAPRYFPGPHPASEPEVTALVQLIKDIQPQIIVHCHSWKPCIVLTGSIGKNCAEYLAKSSGYEFQSDIGYPTPGSLGEYGWNTAQIPVICIEVEEKVDRSKIPALFRSGIEDLFRNGVQP
jgi:protein MpaA